MNRVLYYPGFEVEDENWLKFALLYIGELRPIIPLSGDSTLSDLTLKVREETDLFNFYRPSYADAEWASHIALDVIQRILKNPEIYRHIFHKTDVMRHLSDPNTHKFLVYDEKTIYEFREFCIRNGFATNSNVGTLFNPEIGNTYMTILSNVIAERHNLQCITDKPLMSRYNLLSRDSMRINADNNKNKEQIVKRYRVAKSIIELYLPKGISKIDLNTIIEFRAENDYREALNAFQRQIDSYLLKLETGEAMGDFEEELNYTVRELRRQFLLLAPLTASTAFQVWSIINGNTSLETITSAAVGATSAIHTIKRTLDIYTAGEESRFTRKYLSMLQTIDRRRMKWGTSV
ncbi:hypothetical protein QBE53_06315 [Vallitaleaceae bacterium 9-2]